MAKGFQINGVDFDDIFEPVRNGFDSVTFAGLSPACSYMARTGNASNPNADGYWKYNGVAYDAHPKGYQIPKSLTVGGSWSHTQYTSSAVDTAGLTFTATYQDGSTSSVSVSVSPSSWSSTAGTQTATFTYSYNGVSISATKSASVVEPWSPVALTGASSRTIAFYSISGNLYTNSACTSKASTNTKYTNQTFYYKSNESKPSTSYIYVYLSGIQTLSTFLEHAMAKSTLDTLKNNYPNALIAITGYGTMYNESVCISSKDWTSTERDGDTTFVNALIGYNPVSTSSNVYWRTSKLNFRSGYWGDDAYWICPVSDFPSNIPSKVLSTKCMAKPNAYTQTQYILKTDSL